MFQFDENDAVSLVAEVHGEVTPIPTLQAELRFYPPPERRELRREPLHQSIL
jgi:hypothetical protein